MKASLFLSMLALAIGASASGQETAAPTEKRERRIRVLVNALYNPTGIGFSDTSTLPSFLEEGRSTRSYDGGKGVVFEVGAIVGIRKGLGAMGSVELYQSDFDGVFEESLPHPLYFEQPRTVAGDITGLEYKEKAVHLDAVYTREFPKFTVDVFGGPSFFFTNTEILDTVTTASEYPFDEATVRSTSNATLDDNPIGFNAGGALTWRLTEVVGVAFQARYSRATIGIAREGGDEVELDAGGFRVGGGIRLSF
ncbi:MAG: hypothetical protein ACRD1Z_16960 [Vicinamibacteria bacterium]